MLNKSRSSILSSNQPSYSLHWQCPFGCWWSHWGSATAHTSLPLTKLIFTQTQKLSTAVRTSWEGITQSHLRDFLRRPYNSRRNSREIGFRCMKLQNPPLVHSLITRKIHVQQLTYFFHSCKIRKETITFVVNNNTWQITKC